MFARAVARVETLSVVLLAAATGDTTAQETVRGATPAFAVAVNRSEKGSLLPALRAKPPEPSVLTSSIGARLRLIPAGEFMMGSPDTDKTAYGDEQPQHRVRITRPFYLGITEVTRGEFRRFVDDSGYRTEAEKDPRLGGWGWDAETKSFDQSSAYTWRNPGFEQTDEHPVVNVSWNDAEAFCRWLSRKEGRTYRLPTEAEWEYACRAGTNTRYQCGDDPEGLVDVGNLADGTARASVRGWTTIRAKDGVVFTAPVGRYKPNEWGLCDMHGNVWEWCSDWYAGDYYERSPADDPPGPAGTKGSDRICRGGAYCYGPRTARSAHRYKLPPYNRLYALGFRLVADQSTG
jgi:formylglycine-generating enzyme required for sulfatase activity